MHLSYISKRFSATSSKEGFLKGLEIVTSQIFLFIFFSLFSVHPIISFIFCFLQVPLFLFASKRKKIVFLSVLVLLFCYVFAGMFFNCLMAFFCLFFLHLFIFYRFIFYRKKQVSARFYFQVIGLLLFPFLVMFLVEFMQGNLKNYFSYLFLGYYQSYIANQFGFWVTIFALWCSLGIFSVFIKKKNLCILFISAPCFLFGMINMVVLSLTSSPLLPSDIFIFQTAMDVIGEQRVTIRLILLFLVTSFFIFLFYFTYGRLFKGSVFLFRNRVFFGTLSLLLLFGTGHFISHVSMLNFQANYRYGFLYHFATGFREEIPEPKGYQKSEISTSLPEISGDPNVIIIMSEAFSDLSHTYDFHTSEDPIPFFHSLQQNFPHGVTYSSVFGNNTVSSEFEALTGISTGFTTKGSNIYQKYLEDGFYSFGSCLQPFGYQAEVFHPSSKNNYNRSAAYEKMQYDSQLFLEDLPKDTETIRSFISDEADYKKIESLLSDSEKPLFLMNITMQNHASYNKKVSLDPWISITGMDRKHSDTEQYLSLLKQSDTALQTLISRLSALSEPTVVLFFGDHQPMLDTSFYSDAIGSEFTELSLEEKARTYEIPYLFWSNYDTGGSVTMPEVTSMNYLSLLLNQYIGNPDSEWFTLLSEVRKVFPVITENFVIDSKGIITSMAEVKEKLKSVSVNDPSDYGVLKRYQCSCYMFVKEN